MTLQPDADGAILALDLGSSRLKAAWVSTDGVMQDLSRTQSPMSTDHAQADDVWDSIAAILRHQLALASAPVRIIAVALTGLTRTHVFLDDRGRTLGPIIRWDDPYGEAGAAEVAAAYGTHADADTTRFGAYHPVARLLQFKRDAAAAPAHMLELRDWLNYRLTGRLATDSVAYGRLRGECVTTGEVLDHLGFDARVIPLPRAPESRLGPARRLEASGLQRLDGVPVITGSFDTWCSTLGMGAIAEGVGYDISGTTEVMGVFRAAPATSPGSVCLRWTSSLWQIGGPCQTGLGTLAWFARCFLDSTDPAATLAAASESVAIDPPLCLPYLAGERVPWWRSDLTASFRGIRACHTRNDLARGLAEGLALAHRLALDEVRIRGRHIRLHMGGGGSALRQWCQMRADAFGSPITVGDNPESALVGAALAAAVALGYHPTLSVAQQAVARRQRIVTPDPQRARYFDARARIFRELLQKDLRAHS